MDSDVVVVRVYLKEADHGRRRSLMEEILNILHDQHRVHGVVVFRGIAGLGSKGEVHAADILRLTVDLPIVIEFYDEPEVALAAMDLLSDLVPAGHIVHWRASCRGGVR
jgi:PII-like signaling protein